jgi:anti-sigma factor ChrR (cupin superfamily)
MNCSLSPQPADAELLAYLDGDNTLAEHIAHCPACRARVQALAAAEQQLQQHLYRVDCPSAQTLGEYVLSMIDRSQRKSIRAHLAICPACRDEVEVLQTYLQALAPAPEPGLRDQVRELVARLIQGGQGTMTGVGGLQPAMAGIRGADAGPMIYEADDYQLAIEYHEDPEKPGRRVLYGLLIGDEDPSAFEVQLWREEELVAHAAVDASGNFSIEGLQPGDYDMKLIRPSLSIRLDDLTI